MPAAAAPDSVSFVTFALFMSATPYRVASPAVLHGLSLGGTLVFLFLVLAAGMIPGLLALGVGYLLAQWLAGTRPSQRLGRYGPKVAALLVGLMPLVLFAGVVMGAGSAVGSLRDEFDGLFDKLVSVLNNWRALLPEFLAAKVPSDSGVHDLLVEQVKNSAGLLATLGKTWLGGLVQVIVGVIVGVLLMLDDQPREVGLARAIRERALIFIDTFRSIVTAQFFIALINTAFTALYLFGLLPLFGIQMPYALALTLLTFVAGMLPIVGNLLCNVVLTLMSLSVGPGVALASLSFLIAIHKIEYIINSAIVGSKTQIAIWEMLLAIFIGEILFGVAGLVAAPLFYAYVKRELKQLPYLQHAQK